MKNTILKLNAEISISILSGIVMLFSFVSGYSPINSLVSFLLVFIKSFIFFIIPLLMYVLEKNNLKFKKVAGIYTSYFIINLFTTIILLSSLLILIEQMLNYADVRSKVYSNTIMKLVYLVGNFISYPFLSFINKQIQDKDRDE